MMSETFHSFLRTVPNPSPPPPPAPSAKPACGKNSGGIEAEGAAAGGTRPPREISGNLGQIFVEKMDAIGHTLSLSLSFSARL